MNERALLLVRILEEAEPRRVQVEITLQDDTTAAIWVDKTILRKIPNSKNSQAWLNVEFSGERDGVCGVELPVPILDKGKRVSVKSNRIQRMS